MSANASHVSFSWWLQNPIHPLEITRRDGAPRCMVVVTHKQTSRCRTYFVCASYLLILASCNGLSDQTILYHVPWTVRMVRTPFVFAFSRFEIPLRDTLSRTLFVATLVRARKFHLFVSCGCRQTHTHTHVHAAAHTHQSLNTHTHRKSRHTLTALCIVWK